MHRLLRRATLLCLLLAVTHHAVAHTPAFGHVAAELPVAATHLLADPARTYVYACVPTGNAVAVIESTLLEVVATIPVDGKPVCMAQSADGISLYVACPKMISVIDLNAFQVVNSIPVTEGAGIDIESIAAGPDGRVFVSVGDYSPQILEIDTATGAVLSQAQDHLWRLMEGVLPIQATPDHNTLYAYQSTRYIPSLVSYDVSSPGLKRIGYGPALAQSYQGPVVSPGGTYVCVPCGGTEPAPADGPPAYPSLFRTNLYSTDGSYTLLGALEDTLDPGDVAFAPNDSLVYQIRDGYLQVYDPTYTFPLADAVHKKEVVDIVVDSTGAYVFLANGTSTVSVLASATSAAVAGPPTPVISAPRRTVQARPGVPFNLPIQATNQPTQYAARGLPAGLSIDPQTGLISGVPMAGSFPVTVLATNDGGTARMRLTFEIADGSPGPYLTDTQAEVAGFTNVPFNYQIAVRDRAVSFGAVGLPAGLAIDPTTGIISGQPQRRGTSTVLVYALKAGAMYPGVLTLTVGQAPTVSVDTVVATTSPGDTPGQFILKCSSKLSEGLTVQYTLTGTAKNGVDYEQLPAEVTIPVDSSDAVILITAMGDLRGKTSRTMQLTVLAGSNYALGKTAAGTVTITAPQD